MRLLLPLLLAATLIPWSAAPAQRCEQTFVKKGNPVTGLRFTAQSAIEALATRDAINQLRGIVLTRGYDVLASEPDAGDLLMESPQSATRRSFPIIAKATAAGSMTTLHLQANMRAGVFANTDSVRSEMCGILIALQGGAAGAAAAREGLSTTANNAPTVMSAQLFAERLSKEHDRNVNEIPLRYKDHSFTLDGTVATVTRNGDSYSVLFDIQPWEKKAIHVPGESQYKTDIVCTLAAGQSVYALTLKPKTKVTLTGTYREYRELALSAMVWLDECRPAR